MPAYEGLREEVTQKGGNRVLGPETKKYPSFQINKDDCENLVPSLGRRTWQREKQIFKISDVHRGKYTLNIFICFSYIDKRVLLEGSSKSQEGSHRNRKPSHLPGRAAPLAQKQTRISPVQNHESNTALL